MQSNDWPALVAERFALSSAVPSAFFEVNADGLTAACLAMAKRFKRGGRLLVFGSGSSATDAQHVSVEFVHPVIVGKRALPAVALTNDGATLLGLSETKGLDSIFARQLQLLGGGNDIALGLSPGGAGTSVRCGLQAAKMLGMLTIELSGDLGNPSEEWDFAFSVPCSDPYVVQEVQETAYHVLWETVHVFFEHEGLLAK